MYIRNSVVHEITADATPLKRAFDAANRGADSFAAPAAGESGVTAPVARRPITKIVDRRTGEPLMEFGHRGDVDSDSAPEVREVDLSAIERVVERTKQRAAERRRRGME